MNTPSNSTADYANPAAPDKWYQSLGAKLMLPILAVMAVGIGVLKFYVPDALQANAIANVTESATETVNQYKTLRKYYVQNVIKKVVGKSDVSASFDHSGKEKTIPLPATLIHDMSDLLADKGTSLKLYSGFPFPNRSERKLDAFGQGAWDFLNKNPDGAYVKTENINGE